MARAIVSLLVGVAFGACIGPGAFACETDAQCDDGSRVGRCEPSGWCSFPDSTCESGYKYGAHASDGLASACVGASAGSSGEPEPTTTGAGASTAADPSLDTDASLDASLDTGDTSLGSTTAPLGSGSGDSSSSGAASEDTGVPLDPAVFIDDFERPDDTALGNGWIEKTDTAFQIVDGEVRFESSAGGHQDNLWYRDESLLDVEVCVEHRILAVDANNHPQLHARIQPDDVSRPGSVTSYILYVAAPALAVRRDIGGSFQQEWTDSLSAPLEVGPWYRLCMIVVGTDPVQLEGRLWIEGPAGWTLHTEVLAIDDTADRITTPGATGSSGADPEQVANLVYDHFRRTDLSAP